MIRLLGFLVGSAVSIGAILLIVGIPELNLSNPHLDKDRFEEALHQLREKQRELELAATRKTVEEPEPQIDADNAPAAEQFPRQGETTVAREAEPAVEAVDTAGPFVGAPSPESEQHWYTFWNPFRSEIAARGFVSQLERVTGLDYRVIKVKAGVYEVAFAYESDADRQKRLAQIQAATGLDLPGS